MKCSVRGEVLRNNRSVSVLVLPTESHRGTIRTTEKKLRYSMRSNLLCGSLFHSVVLCGQIDLKLRHYRNNLTSVRALNNCYER